MTMSPEGGTPESHDYLNKLASEMSESKARDLRIGAIALVHEAFSVLLREDVQNDVEQHLEIDLLASPGLAIHELEDALTYTLVRTKPRVPGDTFGADRIQMFLPIDRDFDLGEEPSELPDVNEVNEIFVKFEKDKDGETVVRRFAISKDQVYEYVAPTDPDRDAEESDILSRDIHYLSTDTQNLNMLMIAQLIEDHRNFTIRSKIADQYTA